MKIRIKKSHRGRLTDLKKRTGKTEAELYNDGNPAHKKMVVFARNSRKWKHGLGGDLNTYNYGNTFGGGGLFGNETVDTVASFLPIVGTAEDAYQFYKDPSWANAGWLALSLGSDIFTGGMAARGIKALRMANKAHDAAQAANRAARRTWEAGKAANTAQSGSVKGADMRRMINSVKAAGATRQAAIRRANDALFEAGVATGVDQGLNGFINAAQMDLLPDFGLSYEKKHGLGGNLFYPGGEITYGQPYYSYDNNKLILDENGKPILNYNASLSDIIITPQKSVVGYNIDEDKRSDTTTKGRHERPIPWNAGALGSADSPLVLTTINVTRNPNVITGEPLLPLFGKIAPSNVTERLLKYLGKPLTRLPRKPLSKGQEIRFRGLKDEQRSELMKQEAIFREAGVDMDRLDMGDLFDAYDMREIALRTNRPERFSIVRPAGDNGFNIYDNIVRGDDIRRIGRTQLYGGDDGNLHMGYIENFTRFDNKIGGVQERGLNSAVSTAKSIGKNGVISGEDYQYAPLQLHVIDKFPNKEILQGRGFYSNINAVKDYNRINKITPSIFEPRQHVSTIEEMRIAPPNVKTSLYGPDIPAFLIKEPNMHVPTKSSVFDPRGLDEEGNMIINWGDYFIFNKGGLLKHKYD